MEYNCNRCGLEFIEKQYLKQHLKKKRLCIAIQMDIDRNIQLAELTKKEGIECEKCNKTYKNQETIRKHKCKVVINDDIVTKKELKELYEKQVSDLKNVIQEMLKNPHSTINNTTNMDNSTTNNTINVTLNCFFDTSGKPIEYLLNQENIKERVLGWMKSKNGILDYILEKFNNKEHPENKMIKSADNKESIELHVAGRWKKYDNNKGSDLILTNVGNDFDVYLDLLKEEFEEYQKNKKCIKDFEKTVMTPLEWGVDVSEDSTKLIEKEIIKNEKGEYVFRNEEEDRSERERIRGGVVKVVHEKIC